MSVVYKKIDTIERFFSDFWKIFPNIIVSDKSIQDNIKNDIIQPIYNRSIDFCNLKNKGEIKIDAFAKGGFGEVGIIKINEDDDNQEIVAIIVSINPSGGFEPSYLPIIIKSLNNPIDFNVEIISQPFKLAPKNTKFLSIYDPFSEIIFGSMLGYLYDLGIGLNWSKYLGVYACGDKNKPLINIIQEKSSVELYQMLSRFIYPNNVIKIINNPKILTNILFQFVYAFYISKKYLGLNHYDCHLRNVMISYINNSIFSFSNKVPNKDYVYHGKKLNDIDYIFYETNTLGDNKPVWIVIKNIGLITKIIDYGLCTSLLYKSQDKNIRRNIGILTKNIYSVVDGGIIPNGNQAVRDILNMEESIGNTMEIQFLLLNLYNYMLYGLDRQSNQIDKNAPIHFSSILNELVNFTKYFYNDPNLQINNFVNNHPEFNVKNNFSWYMSNRNTGIRNNWFSDINNNKFGDIESLMHGLLRVCGSQNHMKMGKYPIMNKFGQIENTNCSLFYLEDDINLDNLNVNRILYMRNSPTTYQENMDQFTKYIERENYYQYNCVLKSSDHIFKYYNVSDKNKKNELCHTFKTRELEKYNINNLIQKQFITDPNISKNIKNNNKILGLSNKSDIYKNSDFQIALIQLNPKSLNKRDFKYKYNQLWFDGKYILNRYTGYLPIISSKIIRVKNNGSVDISTNLNQDLYTSSLDKLKGNGVSGFTINASYFIVPGNLSYLTNKIPTVYGDTVNIIDQIDVDDRKPIGYYYDESKKDLSGTFLPIPKPYRKYFATIYVTNDNRLKIMTYDEFIEKHETFEDPIVYELSNKQLYATTQDVIDLDINNNPVFKNEKLDYKIAFQTGPILIKNGQIVFTEKVQNETKFLIVENDKKSNTIDFGIDKPSNLTEYHIIYNADNNYMFISNEYDYKTYYGMRHSNKYMVHNVLAFDKDENIFFFLIEGRGYDAPGLDRVQLSKFLLNFNIVHAVSLDGGFSANAVFKKHDSDKLYWVNNDPEKRKIGLSLTFKWN